ncbi:hypothetical protein D3C87_1280600 [compost metagenome]
MSQYWTPTVSSYLGRVTKAHILEAVVDGVGYGAAERIKDKKKKEMAEKAEQLLAGSGWLPPLLRTEPPAWLDEPQQAEAEAEAETAADAPETVEPEDLASEPAMPEPEASEIVGPDAEDIAAIDAADFAEPEDAPTLDDVLDPDAPEPEEIAPDVADVEDGAAFYEAAE